MNIPRVVLSGKCAAHALLVWTTSCSNQQIPNEARFRNGSFIGGTQTKGFPKDWKMHHVCSLSKNVESHVVLRNPKTSAQCSGMDPTVVGGPVK